VPNSYRIHFKTFGDFACFPVATELLKTIQQLTSSFTSNRAEFQSNGPVQSQTASVIKPSPSIASDVSGQSIYQTQPAAPQQQLKAAPVAKEAPKPAFSFSIATTEAHMAELVSAMQDKEKHDGILQILHRSLREHQERAFQMFFDAFLG
jgi:hypothetical protein